MNYTIRLDASAASMGEDTRQGMIKWQAKLLREQTSAYRMVKIHSNSEVTSLPP